MRELMGTVERLVEAEEYVKKKVPLEWIAVYDVLRQEQRTAMSFAELLQLASKKGLPTTEAPLHHEVKLLAKFFAGLGLIMYHDEESLSELVVLNPAEFLIGPASRLVNSHSTPSIRKRPVLDQGTASMYEYTDQ